MRVVYLCRWLPMFQKWLSPIASTHPQSLSRIFFPAFLSWQRQRESQFKSWTQRAFSRTQWQNHSSTRPFFWHYPNNGGERGNESAAPQSAIRIGSMKLIHDYETSRNELYDLSIDWQRSWAISSVKGSPLCLHSGRLASNALILMRRSSKEF